MTTTKILNADSITAPHAVVDVTPKAVTSAEPYNPAVMLSTTRESGWGETTHLPIDPRAAVIIAVILAILLPALWALWSLVKGEKS